MTSHAELSRDVALAIGHAPESVQIIHYSTANAICYVYRIVNEVKFEDWVAFDYRSPDVAMPLLKWLIKNHNGVAFLFDGSFAIERGDDWHECDTIEEAIARAVIAVGRK